MSELLSPGIVNLASLALSIVLLLVGLLLWFFVNRASSRRQRADCAAAGSAGSAKAPNALLRRLCEANEPEKEEVAEPSAVEKGKDDDDFIRLGR
ncbi:Uncharacterised protein [Raoultella terrigena]|uniref:Uncharacterized protein YebO n=1 Tax=Raoultella terrigena TaxID=577 RepID=A0A3P8KW49_RAOTE|nr:Uncharacterised protein [Raoultella terrigena]